MSKTMSLSAKHNSSVEDVKQRITDRFNALKSSPYGKMATGSMTWTGDVADIDAQALGQKATAQLAVLEHEVKIDIQLPWLLAGLSGPIESFLKDNIDTVKAEPKLERLDGIAETSHGQSAGR